MRILMLNHNVAWSGGTFYRAYHLSRYLARRGHQVTLLSISPERRFCLSKKMVDRVQLIETPDLFWGRGRTGWDPWDIIRRIYYVRKRTWDLVHAFDSRPAVILPALVLRQKGIPLVLDWADWWGRGGTIEERNTGFLIRYLIGPVEAYFEEAFRIYAHSTTVISSALQKRAVDLNVKPDSIAQIPQGSDTENVYPLEKLKCRADVGLPNKAKIIGYLGVLSKSDGQLLFDTFSSLLKEIDDCNLLLIGKHKTNILDKTGIIETGFVSHDKLVKYLGACDLMMLPLKDTIASRGRWPSKINDYLAAGKPIVATAVGDMKELFLKHEIGIATTDDPVLLAQATKRLLMDEALMSQIGKNSRRVAETELSWQILADRLETHYMKTLKSIQYRT